jgi:hypothetical protein
MLTSLKLLRIAPGPRQTADAPAGVFCSAEEALHCERCPGAARLLPLLAGAPGDGAGGAGLGGCAKRFALGAVCDTREAGGETYYRLSDARVRHRLG